MAFAKVMSSVPGRLVRVVAGAALIAVGATLGGGWLVLSVVGVVPLVAGASDVCLFDPLVGQPLRGRDVRRV